MAAAEVGERIVALFGVRRSVADGESSAVGCTTMFVLMDSRTGLPPWRRAKLTSEVMVTMIRGAVNGNSKRLVGTSWGRERRYEDGLSKHRMEQRYKSL